MGCIVFQISSSVSTLLSLNFIVFDESGITNTFFRRHLRRFVDFARQLQQISEMPAKNRHPFFPKQGELTREVSPAVGAHRRPGGTDAAVDTAGCVRPGRGAGAEGVRKI